MMWSDHEYKWRGVFTNYNGIGSTEKDIVDYWSGYRWHNFDSIINYSFNIPSVC